MLSTSPFRFSRVIFRHVSYSRIACHVLVARPGAASDMALPAAMTHKIV